MITIGRSLSFPTTEARPSRFSSTRHRRVPFRTYHSFSITPSSVKLSSPSPSPSPSPPSASSSTSSSSIMLMATGPTLSLRVMNSLLSLMHAFVFFLLAPFLFAIVSVKSSKEPGGKSKDKDVIRRRAMAIRRIKSVYDEEGIDGDDGLLSVRDYSLFVTDRGDTLFTQSWSPTTSFTKGLVVLLHGLNEHSSRYNRFAKQLNAKGFKVYGMDWIGHGGSDSLHGYVPSLDYAVSDVKAYLKQVLDENPSLPCFCFGHSTGAAIILKAVLDPKIKKLVKGIAITSPAVHVQPSHPIVMMIAPILSLVAPMYQLSEGDRIGMPVSRDPNELIIKYSDPLVFTGAMRVRTGYEILRITSCLQQNLSRISIPFLILHGTSDTITDPEASKKLYESSPSTDKSIKLYPGYLHDLLFEPERDDIAKEIINWLTCRL
ncbi:Alpha/beta-Hydrolases superfamily protein [Zostera marina]|uniref:Alpha/beta-Hydrolases superfamily protein n=1 Tax=Zostera marina TaxID=29655 RepID=A0A0K9NNQ1_ZOSMR|nr:Alpha/beta-Hydrolases superfamily protein [Zostera marina]